MGGREAGGHGALETAVSSSTGWGGGLSSLTRRLECWARGDVLQPTMWLSAGPTAQECGKMCAF